MQVRRVVVADSEEPIGRAPEQGLDHAAREILRRFTEVLVEDVECRRMPLDDLETDALGVSPQLPDRTLGRAVVHWCTAPDSDTTVGIMPTDSRDVNPASLC
jgi:hypothetical protein